VYTFVQGFRLYLQSASFLAIFSIFFVLPFSFVFFEFGLASQLYDNCIWFVFSLCSFEENYMSLTMLYCMVLCILYIPASVWIACCISTCFAISNGYHPSFMKVARSTLSCCGTVLLSRIAAQCIILVPVLIMTLFTSRYGHILPMYGKVIIPAIAYFTLYLSLRYSFIEVIVISERAGAFKAISLCNRVTEGTTLRIFLLQQAYLIGFIIVNIGLYVFLHSMLKIPDQTADWVTTTLLGSINSFYIVITYYIYLSFAAGEPYSQMEKVAEQVFSVPDKTLKRQI